MLTAMALQAQDTWYYLFVGTYTNADKSNGIHVYRFTPSTGEAEEVGVTTGVRNPSYLAVSRDRGNIYAVGESGGGEGALHAYAFDREKGSLRFLNTVPSRGDNPCYVSVDDKKQLVFVGNYSGGNLAAYSLNDDGSIREGGQVIDHEGSGPDTRRQDKPHVHAVVVDPGNKFLFVPDLGTDRISIYNIQPGATQPLSPATPPYAALEGGSGPRHLAFHPNGDYAYVVNELNATVTAFKYRKGKLETIETVSMLAEDFDGAVGAADIHISPDGAFLYASNRGDANEIVIWSIGKNGMLTPAGRQSTLGKTPRNFAIDPTGNYLLAANQNTNDIIIFKRDTRTGSLSDTGKRIRIDKPVCLKFAAQ